jgi:hypothetical protein
VQVFLQERFCLSREYDRWLAAGRRLSRATVEALGVKRHARSVRKRWDRLRSPWVRIKPETVPPAGNPKIRIS